MPTLAEISGEVISLTTMSVKMLVRRVVCQWKVCAAARLLILMNRSHGEGYATLGSERSWEANLEIVS
jgi:hypothetical protein